jgi:alpha-amylase
VQGELWRLCDGAGKAAGMIGWLPEKAVTFVDNHDTGSTQGLWPFLADKVMQGYAYILTHPGAPLHRKHHLSLYIRLSQVFTQTFL